MSENKFGDCPEQYEDGTARLGYDAEDKWEDGSSYLQRIVKEQQAEIAELKDAINSAYTAHADDPVERDAGQKALTLGLWLTEQQAKIERLKHQDDRRKCENCRHADFLDPDLMLAATHEWCELLDDEFAKDFYCKYFEDREEKK